MKHLTLATLLLLTTAGAALAQDSATLAQLPSRRTLMQSPNFGKGRVLIPVTSVPKVSVSPVKVTPVRPPAPPSVSPVKVTPNRTPTVTPQVRQVQISTVRITPVRITPLRIAPIR